MMTQMYYVFAKDIKTPGIISENIFHNTSSDMMTLDVYGDFSGEISIEARVDKNNDSFNQISGINIGDFSIANTIKSNGIYQYAIDGIRDVRVNVLNITGMVNITAKITNSLE